MFPVQGGHKRGDDVRFLANFHPSEKFLVAFKGRGRPSRVGTEFKFKDSNVLNLTLAAAGTVLPTIVDVAQGIDEDQRIGRKIRVRGITISGHIRSNAATNVAETANIYRIILYKDKQTNGATATIADILQDTTVHGHRNLSNTNRFQILFDHVRSINQRAGAYNPTGGTWLSGEFKQTFRFAKAVSVPIEFSGATGALTEIRSNNFGMLWLSQDDNPVTQITMRIRVRYTDS